MTDPEPEVDERRLKGLVRRASQGDREAAGTLFDRYHPRVFRYALSKLGQHQVAEDVASETFARVLRDLDRFRWRGAGFEAWLFRIAYNLVVDHTRKASKDSPDESTAEFADTEESRTPESSVIAAESIREMKEMLNGLTEDQREVVVLRFAAGLDTNEIGEVMGRNPNAVRQIQFRALEQLRARMSHGADV